MSPWTPAAPPFGTWARDTTTPSTWAPATPPFAAWDVLGVDKRRTTEDGGLRIIEGGAVYSAVGLQVIRIIERFRATWTNQTTLPNPWTEAP